MDNMISDLNAEVKRDRDTIRKLEAEVFGLRRELDMKAKEKSPEEWMKMITNEQIANQRLEMELKYFKETANKQAEEARKAKEEANDLRRRLEEERNKTELSSDQTAASNRQMEDEILELRKRLEYSAKLNDEFLQKRDSDEMQKSIEVEEKAHNSDRYQQLQEQMLAMREELDAERERNARQSAELAHARLVIADGEEAFEKKDKEVKFIKLENENLAEEVSVYRMAMELEAKDHGISSSFFVQRKDQPPAGSTRPANVK